MTRLRTALLLWAAAWLIVPLPYFIIAEGSVPVVRIALLAAIATAYAGFIDGSGVAWSMTSILVVHVVLYSILLGLGAMTAAYVIPERWRRIVVGSFILIGFTTVLLFDVYRTPFDDVSMYSNWTGLFQ